MADWGDVRELALTMPRAEEATTRGGLVWRTGKLFVWERPFRATDLARFAELGAQPPAGPILAAAVADEGEKHALAEGEPEVFFTIPHFDGYAAILIRLEAIDRARLAEIIESAWLARAPAKLVAGYLAGPASP